MNSPHRTERFVLFLTSQQREDLETLSQHHGLTPAQMLRRLLQRAISTAPRESVGDVLPLMGERQDPGRFKHRQTHDNFRQAR
jgi:hypothetical protein